MRTYIRRDGDRRPQTGYKKVRFYVPRWVDPFFFIQGSEPEKKVLSELVRRGIYFEHTPQTNTINWPPEVRDIAKSDPSKWEADFLFPQYKIWLEVQGFYFHTLPGAPEADALRLVCIKAAGWRPLFWWDYDIDNRLVELMDSVPEFYWVDPEKQGGKRKTPGLDFYEGGEGIDHLEALRKQLRGRGRGPRARYVSRYRRQGERRAK